MLSEFLIKIGTIADMKGLENVSHGLGALAKKAAVAGTAISAAVGGLTAFTKSSLEELDSIAQLSRETGVATETIQELGRVAETNGGSMEAAMDTVKDLSRTIGQAANGFSDGAGAFKDWGLSAKKANGQVKTVGEMIEEIQKKMQKLSKSQQQALLDDLHIDPKMLQTFRLTNKEWAEAQKLAKAMSLGTATEENANTAASFMDGLTQVGQMIKAVSQYIALGVAPVITEFTGKIRDWFVNNNDMIKDSLKNFADKLKFAVTFVGKLADALDTVIKNTIGWKWALIAIGVIIAIINAASLPMILMWAAIGAAIIAVIAILEDFIRAYNGESSYFGDKWKPAIEFVRAFIKDFNRLKEAFKNSHFLDDFVRAMSTAWDSICQTFKGAWNIIKGIFEVIWGAFTLNDDLVKDGLKDTFNGIIDLVEGFGKGFLNAISSMLKLMRDMFFAVGDYISAPFKAGFEKVAGYVRQFLPKSLADFLGFGVETYPEEKKDDKDKKDDKGKDGEEKKDAKQDGKKGTKQSDKKSGKADLHKKPLEVKATSLPQDKIDQFNKLNDSQKKAFLDKLGAKDSELKTYLIKQSGKKSGKRVSVKNVENARHVTNIKNKTSRTSIKEKIKSLEKVKNVTSKITHTIGKVAGGAASSLAGAGITAASLKKVSTGVPNLSKSAKGAVIKQGAISKVMNNNTKIDIKVTANGNPTQIGRAVGDSVGQSIANTQSKQRL